MREDSAAAASKPRRRWLQFSLRTLLLLMLLVACVAAWVGHEYQKGIRQQSAIAWVEDQGGAIYYEETTEPIWQQRWFGEWFPNRVTHVDLSTTAVNDLQPLAELTSLEALLLEDTPESDLSPLAKLHHLMFLDLTGNSAKSAEIEELQQRLPQLIVWRRPVNFRPASVNREGAITDGHSRQRMFKLPPLPANVSGANFVELPGNHVLLYMYGQSFDTGVDLILVDPLKGTELWSSRCAALGIQHSAYLHEPYVELHANRILVVSLGSQDSFIELLCPDSGTQLHRWQFSYIMY